MADLTEEQRRRVSLWIAALRSGRHEQVQGALTDGENGRCCLGVACEVYKKETGRGAWGGPLHEIDSSLSFRVGSDSAEASIMPTAVADWFGISKDPLTAPHADPATFLNDVLGYNFDQIADALEERYLQ